LVGAVVALLWMVHIAVYVLPTTGGGEPVSLFLNDLLIVLEGIPGFPFFGLIAYALLAYFLIWAVFVGNYRVGLRCFLCNMYPMDPHKTPMNNLLANVWVVILCVVPAVQFCATCFPVFARNTAVNMIFGTQIQYLPFISIFYQYNIFVLGMVLLSFFTLLWLCLCPAKSQAAIDAELATMKLFEERDDVANGAV